MHLRTEIAEEAKKAATNSVLDSVDEEPSSGISTTTVSSSAPSAEGSNYSDPSDATEDFSDTRRTPDFGVFAHWVDADKNTSSYPVLAVEVKYPTENEEGCVLAAGNSPRARAYAISIMNQAEPQIQQQAFHVFKEYPLQTFPKLTHFRIWIAVGAYFREYIFERPPAPPEGKLPSLPTYTTGKTKAQTVFNPEKKDYSASFKSSWKVVVAVAKVS